MNKQKRSFLTNPFMALMAVCVALVGIGCGGDLPMAPAAPTAVSADSSDGNGQVTAMSNGTLRFVVDVNNDDSGYAWPSASQVAHVIVDGNSYAVNFPDIYASNAYIDISLSPGAHTVTLVEDYAATHDLEYSDVGNVTISSGQMVTRYAYFNDKYCHPSCP